MSAGRSSSPSCTVVEDPTPDPPSAVHVSGSSEAAPEPSPRGAGRRAALLAYFADPPAEMRAMDAAWEDALALYGEEGSDAWIAALEDGTHPLCRVRTPDPSA